MSEHVCGYEETTTGHPCRMPTTRRKCPHHGEGQGGPTGRPRKELPEDAADQVEKLAGYGLTQEEIGDLMGVSERTLRNRLREREDLSAAYARGRATYRRDTHKRLRDIAFNRKRELDVDEDVPVSEQRKTLVWIEKSQFGAAERHEFEHAGPDGGPIRVTEVVEAHPDDGDGDR